jgi:hypothetical protein
MNAPDHPLRECLDVLFACGAIVVPFERERVRGYVAAVDDAPYRPARSS